MRFYSQQHQFYVGIDLHARKMYICIINSDGKILVHRNMDSNPENLFQTMILPQKNGELVKPHFLIHNIYVLSHQESTTYLQNAS